MLDSRTVEVKQLAITFHAHHWLLLERQCLTTLVNYFQHCVMNAFAPLNLLNNCLCNRDNPVGHMWPNAYDTETPPCAVVTTNLDNIDSHLSRTEMHAYLHSLC